MKHQTELNQLVNQLEIMVETVQKDNSIQKPDLRRILRFVNKVILVVDQAFQDVLATFDDLKQITKSEVSNGILEELVNEVELLQRRDRYRDVEYICGRLSTLKDLYNHQILPLVEKQAYDKDVWRQVFWLIEDREGRIIDLVNNLVWQIKEIIDKFKRGEISIEELQCISKNSYEELKSSIEELHQLNNKIMGFSGSDGLTELTDIGDDIKKTIITIKPKNNPWISGSFYLIAAIVILSLLMVAGKFMPPIIFPIALIGGLIVFVLIGILQLRNDDKITDKSFQNLLRLTFKQIPFIRSNDKG